MIESLFQNVVLYSDMDRTVIRSIRSKLKSSKSAVASNLTDLFRLLRRTQTLMDTQRELLDAGVPKRQKSDKSPDAQIPFYYSVGGSADGQGMVPWNKECGRAMTPAEGVAWLAEERARKRARL